MSVGAIHSQTVDASKRKDGSCSHVRTWLAMVLLFMKIHVMLNASLALANPVVSPPFFSPLATILAVLLPPLPAGILFFSNTSGRVRFHRNIQERRTDIVVCLRNHGCLVHYTLDYYALVIMKCLRSFKLHY